MFIELTQIVGPLRPTQQMRRLMRADYRRKVSPFALWLLLWLLSFCGLGCLPCAADVDVSGTSANNAKVLHMVWTVTARSFSSTTMDLDVLNAQNAWYYVTVTGMVASQRGSELSDGFVLGPNQRRTFHGIQFLNGNSLAFSADGSAPQAEGMMATDMLCRSFLGSSLPTDSFDAWAAYYGSTDDSSATASALYSIETSIDRMDFWGTLGGITALAGTSSFQYEFYRLTNRQVPFKQLGYLRVLLALYYVPDLVNGTLHAHLTDSLWDQFTFSARQTAPPIANPKLFVSESDAAPAPGRPGFWRSGPASYWHDAWGLGDGGHMLWTLNNDAAHGIENSADWHPNLPQTRNYEVFVFIPHNYATTRSAHYTIFAADGSHAVTINQYAYNDAWVSLGTYPFASGSNGFLRLVDMTGERYITTRVGFDAAQWQPR